MKTACLIAVVWLITNSIISINCTDDTIKHHVKVQQTCLNTDCTNIKLAIHKNGQVITLRLVENNAMFTRSYMATLKRTFRTLDEQGIRYYTMASKGQAWASIGVTSGMVIEGSISLKSEQFELKYDHQSELHYTVQVNQEANDQFCGAITLPVEPNSTSIPWTSNQTFYDSIEFPIRPPLEVYYVELVLVNDYSLFANDFNSNLNNLLAFNHRLVNGLNALTVGLGIHIVLKAVETYTSFDVTREPSISMADYLNKFTTFARANYLRKHNYDAIIAITGQQFVPDGNNVNLQTVGIAFVGQMCRQSATGAILYKRFPNRVQSEQNLALVTAHELGHLLGLIHIELAPIPANCRCNAAGGNCIMNSVSSNTRQWSACSKLTIKNRADAGSNACIFEKPAMPPSVRPVCGNGVIEGNEQCDCTGGDAQCLTCCDQRRCQLKQGNQCSSGSCCRSCRFTNAGQRCTKSEGRYDPGCLVNDMCTGTSARCPDSSIRSDGQQCTGASNAQGICYKGRCKTRTDQCRYIFGQHSADCGDASYNRNVMGNGGGHCGEVPLASNNFAQCLIGDIHCGQIKCLAPASMETLSNTNAIKNGGYAGYTYGQGETACRSINYRLNKIGMVSDGIACGANMLCFDQKCLPVGCIENCYGNGNCVNGRCACNAGFNGPFCAPSCTNNCNNNGVCLRNGTCDCSEGFVLPACTLAVNPPPPQPGPITPPPIIPTLPPFELPFTIPSPNEVLPDLSELSASEIIMIAAAIICGLCLLCLLRCACQSKKVQTVRLVPRQVPRRAPRQVPRRNVEYEDQEDDDDDDRPLKRSFYVN